MQSIWLMLCVLSHLIPAALDGGVQQDGGRRIRHRHRDHHHPTT
jgi:hypothetical protein